MDENENTELGPPVKEWQVEHTGPAPTAAPERPAPDPWRQLIILQTLARLLKVHSTNIDYCEGFRAVMKSMYSLSMYVSEFDRMFIEKLDAKLSDLEDYGMVVVLPGAHENTVKVIRTEDIDAMAMGRTVSIIGEFKGYDELLDAVPRLIKEADKDNEQARCYATPTLGDGVRVIMPNGE